ncbi:Calnexin-like protein [Golovinomyces cichoracearum]|uniref:Calnexin-like protein n=1 Tax=Golovinomyces cichoracearum TaxID=62708 RepID=A0A420IW17_9PEZI|nr:Calnexin-like protein [Golovinomyces cichoracearum]
MRYASSLAAISALLLISPAYGEDKQSILNESKTTEVASSSTTPLPTFTPSTIKAEFVEQFLDGWDDLWKPSHAKKDLKGAAKTDEEWAYIGEFSVEEPTVLKGMVGDKGLVMKSAAAHHAISAKFPKKIDNTGKTLVVQYEVKLQNGLECGGAYLKLLRDTKALHQEEFSNASPYVIMFGPDKCGSTNKVHLIINRKNPKTGEYEEKHLKSPPPARILRTTELYTLIIHPNNTGIIKLNGAQVRSFDLHEDFDPPFNPPKEIDDSTDTKPDNWVDEQRIPDPDAKKPDDWDEDAPYEIVDESATKPEDWLEDEPLNIPDPQAEKPEDWVDEEDGEWTAPTISNPKCIDASGCGPWTKPMIKNPAFKGIWTAPLIDNPAYKGVWKPRKIKNPSYYEDKNPSDLEPMGAIGFELWTMQKDILFDNILIGHSVADADQFADDTFHEKNPYEKLLEIAEKEKEEAKKSSSPSDLSFKNNTLHYIREKLDLFFTIAQKDLIQAIKFVPEVAGSLGALIVLFLFLISSLFRGSSPSDKTLKKSNSNNNAKDTPQKIVSKSSDEVSGLDTGKAEKRKIQTRDSTEEDGDK